MTRKNSPSNEEFRRGVKSVVVSETARHRAGQRNVAKADRNNPQYIRNKNETSKNGGGAVEALGES